MENAGEHSDEAGSIYSKSRNFWEKAMYSFHDLH